jgi:hypothetical protein
MTMSTISASMVTAFSFGLWNVRFRSRSEFGRTVMGHASVYLAVKLLIRPVAPSGPGPVTTAGQVRRKTPRSVRRRVTTVATSNSPPRG